MSRRNCAASTKTNADRLNVVYGASAAEKDFSTITSRELVRVDRIERRDGAEIET